MPIIVSTLKGGIASVKISNIARRNALDQDMFECLAALWPQLAADASVKVVLLQGDGSEFFCSGADLSADLESLDSIDELVGRALLKTQFFPKPIVAAIQGGCVAGGLELAMAADIRIAANDAKIGFPEVCWGIVPSGGAAMKLADQIGQTFALDLLLTGRIISGAEAEKIALVTCACPHDRVLALALERAQKIATNSSMAVQATKECAQGHRMRQYSFLEVQERSVVARVRASGDFKEGKAAFLEKRLPDFDNSRKLQGLNQK
jgi:enoyl-CoA hydratase/carnithine racemase